MDVLFVMIPLGLVLVVFAIWSFVWSVKHDQFDDLERQGWSILFDDDKPVKTPVCVAEPGVAEPVVAKPVFAKPVFAKPVVAKPVVAKPLAAKAGTHSGDAP
jgi:cbb3-type cytochrome oxidase maturation protein